MTKTPLSIDGERPTEQLRQPRRKSQAQPHPPEAIQSSQTGGRRRRQEQQEQEPLAPPPTGTRRKRPRSRRGSGCATFDKGVASWEQQMEVSAIDYYTRLLHQCQKAWNKQVKAIKKLEQLKLSKKRLLRQRNKQNQVAQQEQQEQQPSFHQEGTTSSLRTTGTETTRTTKLDHKDHADVVEGTRNKEQQSTTTTRTTTDHPETTKRHNDMDCQVLKALQVDLVVQEALRRLGMWSLDPRNAPTSTTSRTTGFEARDANTSHCDDDDDGDATNEREHGHAVGGIAPQRKQEPQQQEDQVDESQRLIQPEQEQWIEKLLSHNRLTQLAEEWNAEITKYRQWKYQQEQRLLQSGGQPSQGKKANQHKRQRKGGRTENDQQADAQDRDFLTHGQSLFYQLGNSRVGDDDDDEEEHDDDDNDMEDDALELFSWSAKIAKRNDEEMESCSRSRKMNKSHKRTQPSRKQQQQQQRYDPSQSYHDRKHRQRKQQPEHRIQEQNNGKKKKYQTVPASNDKAMAVAPLTRGRSRGGSTKNGTTTEATTSAATAAQESIHPSWAARKAQTQGIVTFQGTKITFDDE